jgi:hypothetical protein
LDKPQAVIDAVDEVLRQLCWGEALRGSTLAAPEELTGMSGLELQRQLQVLGNHTPWFSSLRDDPGYRAWALRRGCVGSFGNRSGRIDRRCATSLDRREWEVVMTPVACT